MAGLGGDDFEDDYVPDELVAFSGDEEDSHHGSSHGDLSLDDDTLSKPGGSAAAAEGERSKKRKRGSKDKQRMLKVSTSISLRIIRNQTFGSRSPG